MMYLLGGFVEQVIRGQRRGLHFCVHHHYGHDGLHVPVCQDRDLVHAAQYPAPARALEAILALAGETVDSDAIIIAIVAIGIGVDDTIHFLSRLRFESAHNADPDEALKRTFHFSGRAMVTTTVILSAGFLPLGFSDYFTIRIFGTLLPMTLIVAVLADILLVPALVKLRCIRFHKSIPSYDEEGFESLFA